MKWDDPLVIIAALAAAALVGIVALAVLPSTPAFRQIVVGVKTDPQVVGLMRALLFYLVPTICAGVVAYLGNWTDPRLLPLVPILIGAIRLGEGRFDQMMKAKQNAPNPPPVAGGGDPGLLRD